MIKQPVDQVDYDVDFSRWIPEGDTLTTVTARADLIADPLASDDEPPLTIESYEIRGLVVKLWASGGRDGTSYQVTVVVATEQGRVKETEFRLRVRDF